MFDQVCATLTEFDADYNLLAMYKALSVCDNKHSAQLEAVALCRRADILEYFVGFNKKASIPMVKQAAEHGLYELLKEAVTALRAKDRRNPFSQVCLKKVAGNGHTECLLFLLEQGCAPHRGISLAAAENGHLECLQVAHEHGCECDSKILNAAALYGQLSCVTFLLEQGCSPDRTSAYNAALNGHLECLRLLIDHDAPLTKRMCNAAATNGHLSCLQLLFERGCAWDKECARLAVTHNHFECLQYAAENGCRCDSSVADAAAAGGYLSCLEYLLSGHKPASYLAVEHAVRNGHVDCVRALFNAGVSFSVDSFGMEHALVKDNVQFLQTYVAGGYKLPRYGMEEAAEHGSVKCVTFMCSVLHHPLCTEDTAGAASTGQLECLKILHEHGCPWNGGVYKAAATKGHVECLLYAVEHGCPRGKEDLCAAAAGNDKFEALQYLHSQGFPLTLQTCRSAIRALSLKCLGFAVEHGAPLDASLCADAISENECSVARAMEFLRYLREAAHCPWDERTAAAAASYALSVLQYVHDHGCPWDIRTTLAAAEAGNLDCLEFAHENGCPWDETVSEAAAAFSDFEENECFEYCYENHCPMFSSTLRDYNRYNAGLYQEDTCCVM